MLVSDRGWVTPTDWSPDGRTLVFQTRDQQQSDIWILPLDDGGEPSSLIAGEFDESLGVVSPDGRWLLYLSNESGRVEAYVVPFPGLGARWQVTNEGAEFGAGWAVDGTSNEIWFAKADRLLQRETNSEQVEVMTLHSVQWEAREGRFRVGERETLFKLENILAGTFRDGRRLLASIQLDTEEPPPVTLVTNWVETLERD